MNVRQRSIAKGVTVFEAICFNNFLRLIDNVGHIDLHGDNKTS